MAEPLIINIAQSGEKIEVQLNPPYNMTQAEAQRVFNEDEREAAEQARAEAEIEREEAESLRSTSKPFLYVAWASDDTGSDFSLIPNKLLTYRAEIQSSIELTPVFENFSEAEWVYIGNGIESIDLTNTVGLVKTYTITYTDGTTDTFDVTDGADGHSPVITFVGTTIYVDGVAGVDLKGDKGDAFTYDDFTPEQIETLQQPAIDAAAIANTAAESATNLVNSYATDLAAKELKYNKQNSLEPDGTGTKFPTVDAVNEGVGKTNTDIVDLRGSWIEDFNNTGNLNGYIGGALNGGTQTGFFSDQYALGVVLLKSSASANSGYRYYGANTAHGSKCDNGLKMTFIFKLLGSVPTRIMHMGLMITVDHTPHVSDVMVVVEGNNLYGRCAKTSVSSNTSAFSLAYNVWYRATFEITNNTVVFNLYAGNSDVVVFTETISTNIPFGINVYNALVFYNTGTAVENLCLFDYVRTDIKGRIL